MEAARMVECKLCRGSLGPDAGPTQNMHVECGDEWNRRCDAGECVVCGKTRHTADGAGLGGHQCDFVLCRECRDVNPIPWSGYPGGV